MAKASNVFTAEKKIQRAFVYIMKQPEFVGYSGVIMVGASSIEDDPEKCPTAYTDGYNVVYGRKFVDSLSEPEVRALVLHENIHKMYRHTVVWQHLYKRSPILANIAADYVVNGTIKEANCSEVQLPKNALYDPTLSHNHHVGQVFEILFKKYPQLAHPQCYVIGDADGNGNGLEGFPTEGFDEHDWEKAAGWSPEEERSMAEKIDSAIRQGSILAGKVGGQTSRDFDELLKVHIDYREIMRQFFTDTCLGDGDLSYRRPNRRMLQHDLIFPTEMCETLPHIVIGIDTSGSIGGEILTRFMSNVVHLLKQVNPEKIDLVYWDTEVAGHETYERSEIDKLVKVTKPAGGGGTSPACVTRWLKKNKMQPTCVVMLTDGYVDSWPQIDAPLLWCIYENESANPPSGIVAHI